MDRLESLSETHVAAYRAPLRPLWRVLVSVHAACNALAGAKQIFNDPLRTHTAWTTASEAMRLESSTRGIRCQPVKSGPSGSKPAGETVCLVVKVAYGGSLGVCNEEAFFDEISVIAQTP